MGLNRKKGFNLSKIMELISAVTNAERQIDDQISKMRSYEKEIDNISQKIDVVFDGSTLQYGQHMIDQLSQTKRQVSDTIERLQNSKDKLSRVRMV